MKLYAITIFIVLLIGGCVSMHENSSGGSSSDAANDRVVLIPSTTTDSQWVDSCSDRVQAQDVDIQKYVEMFAHYPDLQCIEITPDEFWNAQKQQLYAIVAKPGIDEILFNAVLLRTSNEILELDFDVASVLITDVNNDGVYEIYCNALSGSGNITQRALAYDPRSKKSAKQHHTAVYDYYFIEEEGHLFLVQKDYKKRELAKLLVKIDDDGYIFTSMDK